MLQQRETKLQHFFFFNSEKLRASTSSYFVCFPICTVPHIRWKLVPSFRGLCLKERGGGGVLRACGSWHGADHAAIYSERNVWCGISHCWHSGDGLPAPHHCATAAQQHTHTHKHRNINTSHSAPTLCTAVIGRGRRAHILIDANPDEPTDTLPQHPRPLLAAQLATISLLLAMAVLRLRGGGGRHCQGAPLICYVSQGYGAPGLTGPSRHKPRPPWRLSANPDAWHGPKPPNGSHPRAVDGYDTFPPRAISIMWNFDE